jgi:hypothetical protein
MTDVTGDAGYRYFTDVTGDVMGLAELDLLQIVPSIKWYEEGAR